MLKLMIVAISWLSEGALKGGDQERRQMTMNRPKKEKE